MPRLSEPSPYVEFDRKQWRALRMSTPLALTEEELIGLRGLGEQIDLLEVEEVYLPLARLIHLQVAARQRLFAATAEFLGEPQQNPDRPVPFVIGVAGSVAVGKSTTSRVLQALLARWDHHPRVDLVTTDGFLYPNAELDRRNLMHRKGFPESYNRRALLRFVTSVKSGSDYACAPVYSHLKYDIIPGAKHVVRHPDILILEGLNVLQTGPTLMVSDLFDFSVYVDARIEDIEQWYVSRFLAMRTTAFADPESHFHHYSALNDTKAVAAAREIWRSINRPNLVENILPTPPPRHPGAAQRRRSLHQPAAPAQAVRAARDGNPGKLDRQPAHSQVLQPGEERGVHTAGQRRGDSGGGHRHQLGGHDRRHGVDDVGRDDADPGTAQVRQRGKAEDDQPIEHEESRHGVFLPGCQAGQRRERVGGEGAGQTEQSRQGGVGAHGETQQRIGRIVEGAGW